ncbi:hypothetical protein ILUMI_04691 [Ignelater luminosus]|uniref:Retrovirus-related Pol polyprotein from transposon TNT 1-94 n=1 Tax=Ignelater luminosus TaxID=2038154 RepID=A0A8K0D963_IGNLU|nr:hypothetical protein ILUMI_04691 [Ignelater luminosus]
MTGFLKNIQSLLEAESGCLDCCPFTRAIDMAIVNTHCLYNVIYGNNAISIKDCGKQIAMLYWKLGYGQRTALGRPLTSHFKRKTLMTQIVAKRKLLNLTMLEGKDPKEFFSRFKKHISALKDAGEAVKEEEKLSYLLLILPDKYNHIIDVATKEQWNMSKERFYLSTASQKVNLPVFKAQTHRQSRQQPNLNKPPKNRTLTGHTDAVCVPVYANNTQLREEDCISSFVTKVFQDVDIDFLAAEIQTFETVLPTAVDLSQRPIPRPLTLNTLSAYQNICTPELKNFITLTLQQKILTGWADADWASDCTDRKSTTGILIQVFDNPVI